MIHNSQAMNYIYISLYFHFTSTSAGESQPFILLWLKRSIIPTFIILKFFDPSDKTSRQIMFSGGFWLMFENQKTNFQTLFLIGCALPYFPNNIID